MMPPILIAKVILVLGFATLSVIERIKTDGKNGEGWAVLAFLTLIFMDNG